MALSHFQRTFTDVFGNVQPGLSVEVRRESDGALAALFSDAEGNASLSNPFTTDTSGYGNFYAADGRYRIRATSAGIDWRNFDLINQPDLDGIQGEIDQRTIYVGSVADFEGYTGLVDTQQYQVTSYHPGYNAEARAPVGGGLFVYNAAIPRTEHNGGTVIDPSKSFPSDFSDPAQLSEWFTGDNVGTGCFVRTSFNEIDCSHFGAKAIDSSFDDTPSVQAAFDFFYDNRSSKDLPRKIKFGGNSQYNITKVTANDFFDVEIDLNGASIVGRATTSQNAMMEFFNFKNLRFGNGKVQSLSNLNYERGLYFHGGEGGTIAPTTGLGTELGIHNLLVNNFQRGIVIGNASLDVNLGQGTLDTVRITECPIPLTVDGEQTVLSATSTTLSCRNTMSSPIPESLQAALYCGGATVNFAGGEITSTTGNTQSILMSNSTVNYSYGKVNISSTFIECRTILRIRDNGVDSSTARKSNNSKVGITNCSGFIRGDFYASVIEAAADHYAGTLTFKDSKFYNAGEVRTLPLINAPSACPVTVVTDEDTWELKRGYWTDEVNNGVLRLDSELAFRASDLNGLTLAAGSSTTLVFNTKETTGRFSRLSGNYRTTSGNFTVGAGGIKQLDIQLQAQSQPFSGLIGVRVNGSTVTTLNTSDRINLHRTLYDLSSGDVVALYAVADSAVTFGSSAQDYIQLIVTI